MLKQQYRYIYNVHYITTFSFYAHKKIGQNTREAAVVWAEQTSNTWLLIDPTPKKIALK